MSEAVSYVRYQVTVVDERGRHIGVFAAVNLLRKRGKLSDAHEAFVAGANAEYDHAYLDPASIDATVYDRHHHPPAAAWFKSSAEHLILGVHGYLDILDAHAIPWQRLQTSIPGRVIYDDEHQVIVS